MIRLIWPYNETQSYWKGYLAIHINRQNTCESVIQIKVLVFQVNLFRRIAGLPIGIFSEYAVNWLSASGTGTIRKITRMYAIFCSSSSIFTTHASAALTGNNDVQKHLRWGWGRCCGLALTGGGVRATTVAEAHSVCAPTPSTLLLSIINVDLVIRCVHP